MRIPLHKRVSFKFMLPATALLLVAASLLILYVSSSTRAEYEHLAAEQVQEAQRIADNALSVTDDLMMERVHAALDALQGRASASGIPRLEGEDVVGQHRVPDLHFGNESQTLQYRVVDEVTETLGGTATLFVKSGSDFVRVSTNVIKDDGTRAVGTKLKADVTANDAQDPPLGLYLLNKPYEEETMLRVARVLEGMAG